MPSRMRGFYRKGGFYGRYNRLNRGSRLGELKFHEIVKGSTNLSGTGVILEDTVVDIAEGVGEEQRIGRKISLKYIDFRIEVTLNSATSASATDDCYRIIIYNDKQCNGTAAAITELLAVADIDSYRNLSFSHRFRILYDKKRAINCTAFGSNGTTHIAAEHMHCLKIHIPLHDMQIIYNKALTTGALSTIESNNIGILGISMNGLCQIEYRGRLRYRE